MHAACNGLESVPRDISTYCSSQAHSRIQGQYQSSFRIFWFGFTVQDSKSGNRGGWHGSTELSAVARPYVACALLLYYTKGHWLEFAYGYLEISLMRREAHLCTKIDFAIKPITFH
jgi:hypothetical protein